MRARTGLTLVEVTVAVALLSVVLAGAFAALSVAMRADAAAREHRAASDAAHSTLDRLLATGDFDALVAAGPSGFHAPFETGRGAVNLRPASPACFDPGGDDPTMAGHVRVVLDPDLPGRAAPDDDDADDDAGDGDDPDEAPPVQVELVEVQVTVAWRGQDGADRRVDVVSRRAR